MSNCLNGMCCAEEIKELLQEEGVISSIQELSLEIFKSIGNKVSTEDVLCSRSTIQDPLYFAIVNNKVRVGRIVLNKKGYPFTFSDNGCDLYPISLSHLIGEPVEINPDNMQVVTAIVSVDNFLESKKEVL